MQWASVAAQLLNDRDGAAFRFHRDMTLIFRLLGG